MQISKHARMKAFLIKRHLIPIKNHLTWRKIMNSIMNQIEYFLRRNRLLSFPLFLKIEPSRLCQLKCPGCSHNIHKSMLQNNKGFMSLDSFCKIVEPFTKTLIGISLSGTGEPMLNKDLISMIEYANSKNIGVNYPTNFSLQFSDNYLEKLVKSGLDKIMISMDGISGETYNLYRVGGDVELVKYNVKRLSEIKCNLKMKNPHIEWKFIVFEHNKHEVDKALKVYKEWGFDSISLENDNYSEEARGQVRKHYKNKKVCFWPYSTMHFCWDGTVAPCCDRLRKWDIGIGISTNVKDIWNNTKYKRIRKGFTSNNGRKKMLSYCKACFIKKGISID